MKRNFGLDIIRALAISLVLIDHGWYFNPNISSFQTNQFAVTGLMGVEIFFVLSGFLIGRIAFKTLGVRKIKNIHTFYLRRWFRTLPLYYLLLTVFIVASNFVYHTNDTHPLHYIFLQNFITRESDFFSIAWSLAIEEWFYLLLPIFLFLASLKAKTGKGLLQAVTLAIGILFLVRLGVVLTHNFGFNELRKFIPLRFDSLLTGVFLAGVKMYYDQLYFKLQNVKIFTCSVFILLGLSAFYTYLNAFGLIDASLFFKSIGLSLISLSVAGTLPFIESSFFINNKVASLKYLYRGVTGLSIISYSLYLVHLEINTIVIKYFSFHVPAAIPFSIATLTGILSSIFLYRLVEKPVMTLRDRITSRQKINPLSLKNLFSRNPIV